VHLVPGDAAHPTACELAGLDALRRAIPAARGLPLLQALARGDATAVTLDYLDGLALGVTIDMPGAAR
jgi:hypothetical protein